jgi:hypothetical protein
MMDGSNGAAFAPERTNMNTSQFVAWIADWTDENLEQHIAKFEDSVQHALAGLIEDGSQLKLMREEQKRRETQKRKEVWEATRPERERLMAEAKKLEEAGDFRGANAALDQAEALTAATRPTAKA